MNISKKINDFAKDRPVLLVLVGIPGSGKSTWAEKLMAASDRQFVVVSSDLVIDQLAKRDGITYSESHDKYLMLAIGIAERDFRESLAAGKNIIHDKTNVSRSRRETILQDLPNQYIKVAVVFDVPDKVLEKRLADRAKATGKSIPKDVVKEFFSAWQSPSKAEGFDLIIKV